MRSSMPVEGIRTLSPSYKPSGVPQLQVEFSASELRMMALRSSLQPEDQPLLQDLVEHSLLLLLLVTLRSCPPPPTA